MCLSVVLSVGRWLYIVQLEEHPLCLWPCGQKLWDTVPTSDSAEILKHKSRIVPTPCSLLPFFFTPHVLCCQTALDRVTCSGSVIDCRDIVSEAVSPLLSPSPISQCDYQPCSVSCVTAELNRHRNSFSPGSVADQLRSVGITDYCSSCLHSNRILFICPLADRPSGLISCNRH